MNYQLKIEPSLAAEIVKNGSIDDRIKNTLEEIADHFDEQFVADKVGTVRLPNGQKSKVMAQIPKVLPGIPALSVFGIRRDGLELFLYRTDDHEKLFPSVKINEPHEFLNG